MWNEGFLAGQVVNSECPYPVGSPMAKEWMQGWGEGIRARGNTAAASMKSVGTGLKRLIRKLAGR